MSRPARWALPGAALLALSAFAPAFARPTPIVTSDLLKLRTVTAIDVAADGSKAVYAVKSIAEAEPKDEGAGAQPEPKRGDDPEPPGPRYEYRSHLYVVALEPGTAPRQLTFGERRDGNPLLSPDGRRVAFVRAGPGEGDKAQVWVLPLDGGEARVVTDFEHGAALRDWSPDGRKLLVASDVPADELEGAPPWPAERPGRSWGDDTPAPGADVTARPDGTRQEIRAWLAANARAQDPVVITRLEFQGELSLRGAMTFTQLYLVDVDAQPAGENGKPPEPQRISRGFHNHGDAAFMPDGRGIVYVARKLADRHPDREIATDLWKINADGTGDRLLLSLDGWTFEDPQPSADGRHVAFVGARTDEPAFRQRQLGLIASEGGAAVTWLTDEASFDAPVLSIAWSPARDAIVFNTAREGGFPLLNISDGLLEPAVVVARYGDQLAGVDVFDAGGAAIVYALTTPAAPCVLLARDGRGERVIEDLNPWVADRKISLPSEGWLSRPDGVSVQYWLMEPTDRIKGQQYPLALEMHGGPHAMWGPGEFTMWHEFQLLCSWGYGVVYCNPRGSSGYGYAFQKGNFQDWGAGPAGDVLAVTDHVTRFTDWIDPKRLVLTGGSYAGYLTAWIVANDHRFKAAVAQRGVYDIATFFGEGNAWRLVEYSMGGFPFDERARRVIDRNSPFTYASRIQTPLLIMHGSSDLRTGVSQSEMMYRALKALGRPVEYVRYPGAGHDLSRTGDPRQRMDRLDRIVEFFERYTENTRPAPH